MDKRNKVKTKLPLWSGGSAACIVTLAPHCGECSAGLLWHVLTAWGTGGLAGPQSSSAFCEEERSLLALPGIEPRLFRFPADSLFPLLSCPASWVVVIFVWSAFSLSWWWFVCEVPLACPASWVVVICVWSAFSLSCLVGGGDLCVKCL